MTRKKAVESRTNEDDRAYRRIELVGEGVDALTDHAPKIAEDFSTDRLVPGEGLNLLVETT